MLLVVIALGVTGYALVYAGIRGDRAQIGGVPLWRAPWLPFLAAFTRGTQPGVNSSNANQPGQKGKGMLVTPSAGPVYGAR